MSIPRCDVEFLQRVTKRMAAHHLVTHKPHHNRGASAIVLRFPAASGSKVAHLFAPHDLRGATPAAVLERLHAHSDPDVLSELTMLFLRKKTIDDNRWAGKVSFLTGKRDPAEDRNELDTVVREARSQLGMPLDSPDFLLLGQMTDLRLYSRRLRESVVFGQYVFLHLGDLTPSIRVTNAFDIESVHWLPIRALDRKFVVRHQVKFPLSSYFNTKDSNEVLYSLVRHNFLVRFPSVPLPQETGEIWGATLSSASSLLWLGGRRRCDWPLFSIDNMLIQWFVVMPWHFYKELSDPEYRPEMDPIRVASFVMLFVYLGVFLLELGNFSVTLVRAAHVTKESMDPATMASTRKYKVGTMEATDVHRRLRDVPSSSQSSSTSTEEELASLAHRTPAASAETGDDPSDNNPSAGAATSARGEPNVHPSAVSPPRLVGAFGDGF